MRLIERPQKYLIMELAGIQPEDRIGRQIDNKRSSVTPYSSVSITEKKRNDSVFPVFSER